MSDFTGGHAGVAEAARPDTKLTPHGHAQAWNYRHPGGVQTPGTRRFTMRVLFGIILGGLLTVGAAYLYDSHNAVQATNAPTAAQRPLVNWDTVSIKWEYLTERARSEWNRLAG
jgi:hypothetical protein